MTLVKEGRW